MLLVAAGGVGGGWGVSEAIGVVCRSVRQSTGASGGAVPGTAKAVAWFYSGNANGHWSIAAPVKLLTTVSFDGLRLLKADV